MATRYRKSNKPYLSTTPKTINVSKAKTSTNNYNKDTVQKVKQSTKMVSVTSGEIENDNMKDSNVELGSNLENKEWEVEKVIDKRIRKKKVEYLLKWKGHKKENNSWEPEKNLRCNELIKEFEENVSRAEIEKKLKGKTGRAGRKRNTSNSTMLTVASSKEISSPRYETQKRKTKIDTDIKVNKLGKPKGKVNDKKHIYKGSLGKKTSVKIMNYKKKETNVNSDTGSDSNLKEHEKEVESEDILDCGPTISGDISVNAHINKVPENILGATTIDMNLVFLIKWKDIEEGSLIPAKDANILWPQVVIKFYEDRLQWDN